MCVSLLKHIELHRPVCWASTGRVCVASLVSLLIVGCHVCPGVCCQALMCFVLSLFAVCCGFCPCVGSVARCVVVMFCVVLVCCVSAPCLLFLLPLWLYELYASLLLVCCRLLFVLVFDVVIVCCQRHGFYLDTEQQRSR